MRTINHDLGNYRDLGDHQDCDGKSLHRRERLPQGAQNLLALPKSLPPDTYLDKPYEPDHSGPDGDRVNLYRFGHRWSDRCRPLSLER